MVGAIGEGNMVSPISHWSTPAAHERPSAIAHTMRLCPRPMSPQANTPGLAGHERRVARDVAPRVELDAEVLEQAGAFGAEEAHREQHELARQLEVGALDLLEPAVDHLDLVRTQRAHVAVVVADEALGVHAVDALAALFVRRRHPEDVGERRPRVGGRAGVGRRGRISNWCTDTAPWRCAVPRQSAPVSPPPMITTRLPAAVIGGVVEVALLHAVADGQVLHRLVDAAELATGDRQVAPRGRATGEHDRVELAPQLARP